MNKLSATILNAQLLAVETLKQTNQRLAYYLESPFLPVSEKMKIQRQIEENRTKINHLSVVHELHKVA
ncbi:hypothetical protein K1X84_03185 [bacterium]|nr:hypothetical protein [bacterium]